MAVATLTASLVVSGCTTWSTTGPDQATLDGTVLAVYYSPQTYTWGEPGHVLLVDRTVRSTALQTSGMDVASLVWTNAGLYFSDTERDYLLGGRLQSWPSTKANLQESAFELAGGVRVSLFNQGVVDGTYVEQVVVNDGAQSTGYDVEGYNQAVAVCGDEVYAVAELTGDANRTKAEAAGVNLDARMPQMLTRLYPRASEPGGGFVAAYPTEEANYLTSDEACGSDGVMHYLVEVLEGGSYQHVIRSWNTRTGAATQHPVVDTSGEPLLTQQSFTFPVASTTLSRSGELIWMSEDGTVRSTDPATGVSRALWSTGRTLGGSGDTAVRFEDGSLFLLERVAGADDLVLSRYATESGDGGVVLTLPGVGGRESLRQVRRDFAVAPEWAAQA